MPINILAWLLLRGGQAAVNGAIKIRDGDGNGND